MNINPSFLQIISPFFLLTKHTMVSRMFKDIRKGIEMDTLDEVESKYVHPNLMRSKQDTETMGA